MTSFSLTIQCSKGFGSPKSSNSKPSKKSKLPGDAQLKRNQPDAVERAIKVVEDRAPNINPDQAAQGRVDFIKVKNWGSGKEEDLGDLQVESKVSTVGATGMSFHEQLTRHLQTLEAQGTLAVAQPKGTAPLPPFQRWAFAKDHYLQYLSDMLCVHTAIEQAMDQCYQTIITLNTTKSESEIIVKAIKLLGSESKLQRSASITLDLANITVNSQVPEPNPNASTYAGYLTTLSNQCINADDLEEASSSALKLLSHAYILYLTLMSSGTRIGAAAAEKLNLFAMDALHVYRSYPDDLPKPLEALIEAVNVIGEDLNDDDKDVFMEELPVSMQRASLLLSALARER